MRSAEEKKTLSKKNILWSKSVTTNIKRKIFQSFD